MPVSCGTVPGLSNNSEAQREPHCLSECLKKPLQKFTNLNLDSYEGQLILKDKFLSQCASDIRIKLQQLQQQDPAAPLDEMVQTATNTFYNREQETEAKAQEERKKETRHAQMLAALQRNPMANPESLRDKAQDRCLICRQAGHWAKECPNRDKSPRTACHKCHQLGHWAALCPRDPRASRSSAKPTLTMVQED